MRNTKEQRRSDSSVNIPLWIRFQDSEKGEMFGRALNHGINKGEYGSPLSRIEGERVKLRRQEIHEKGRNKLATKAEKEETPKLWDNMPPPKLDSTQTNQL